jgi:hypothetical protein
MNPREQKRTNYSTLKTINIIIGCLNEVKGSYLSNVRTELIISFVVNVLNILNCMPLDDFINFII